MPSDNHMDYVRLLDTKQVHEMEQAFSIAGAGAQEEADQEAEPGTTQPQPGEAQA